MPGRSHCPGWVTPGARNLGCPLTNCKRFAPFLLAMLVIGVVAMTLSVREKSNLLPAAGQMQCHLGVFLLAQIAFGWFWTARAASLDDARIFKSMQRAFLIDDNVVAFLFWFLPTDGLSVLDGIFVWKGTWASRYANR
ncbi:MAG: hypothetical protein ACUVXJ_07065 [Phycisphaerae bacterium]